MKEKFRVTGMTCSACSLHVEKQVSYLMGVKSVSVSLLTNSMVVEYDEETVSPEDIIKTVISAGYSAEKFKEDKKKSSQNPKKETDERLKSMKTRLIVSFSFLIPLMYISMGSMVGLPVPHFISGHENPIGFAFLQFLLCLPILYINRIYYISGFKRLFKGAPNMDSLIAIGSASSLIYGIYVIFKMTFAAHSGDMDLLASYHMDLYFESAVMILTLITLGKFFEERSKGKTGAAISALMDLAPPTALVERDGKEIEISTDDVLVGDLVIVKPGMSIPVDGVVVFGESAIDESALTGESIHVEKTVGDKVTGGTINKSGFIKMKATKVGEDTTLSSIIALVEEASSGKAPISRLADKISGIFVPVVILIALVTFAIWMISGADFETAMSFGIAVLVISCPCALGLATPVAIMVGTGKGATNGILIKSGEALQILKSVDTVVLDKTGTITKGTPSVTRMISLCDENELLSIAYSLEKNSEHPISSAICEYAKGKEAETLDTEDFTAIHGRGVKATIDGKTYYAGNEKMLESVGIEILKYPEISEFTMESETYVFVSDSDRLLGAFSLSDKVKPSSKSAVDSLIKMGIDVVMLTGDNNQAAEKIAKEVGIKNFISKVLPEDKESNIRKMKSEGKKVAMVGDGINDAPALAGADVGIAIGAGTSVAIDSADIVLVRNDLTDVVSAIKLSKKVIVNIKENLFWAFFYNLICIPVAAGVFYSSLGLKLSPIYAAAAMSFSSVCVVLNALRLRKFKIDNNIKGESEMEIIIDGMACGHCSARVEKLLNEIDGVTATVDLEKKTAYVTCGDVTEDVLKSAIEDAGYTVVSIK